MNIIPLTVISQCLLNGTGREMTSLVPKVISETYSRGFNGYLSQSKVC